MWLVMVAQSSSQETPKAPSHSQIALHENDIVRDCSGNYFPFFQKACDCSGLSLPLSIYEQPKET